MNNHISSANNLQSNITGLDLIGNRSAITGLDLIGNRSNITGLDLIGA